eukprot:m.27113 g.27113  ORF g.27113 m.27113 type:complete len:99 (+) comp13876_c0_seq1:459-755(+)
MVKWVLALTSTPLSAVVSVAAVAVEALAVVTALLPLAEDVVACKFLSHPTNNHKSRIPLCNGACPLIPLSRRLPSLFSFNLFPHKFSFCVLPLFTRTS